MSEARLLTRDLVAGYVPGMPVVNGISAVLGAGEIVSIIGPNGAGKSTLIKAIAGLVPVEAGAVIVEDRDITGIRPDRLFKHAIAYVPQTANIFQGLSVQQNLVLAGRRLQDGRDEAHAEILALFPQLAERPTLRAGRLSGGQRQVLAIAMALIARPRVLLMDEPTAGLSPIAAGEVLQLIRKVASDGVSVLLVEQNAKAALRISDRAYVLAEGRTQHEGTGPDLLDDPAVGEIYLGSRRREVA